MSTRPKTTESLMNQFVTNRHDPNKTVGVVVAMLNPDQVMVHFKGANRPNPEWRDELVRAHSAAAEMSVAS